MTQKEEIALTVLATGAAWLGWDVWLPNLPETTHIIVGEKPQVMEVIEAAEQRTGITYGQFVAPKDSQ